MATAVSNFHSNTAPRAFLISMGLHLGVSALLLGVATRSPLPLGSRLRGSPTVIELTGSTRFANSETKSVRPLVKTRPVKPKVRGETTVVVPKPEESVESSVPAEKFGLADGNTTEGQLGVENGVDASAIERYLYELRLLIAHRKTYPAASKRLGETGRVVVKFEIDREGRIDQPGLRAPSPYSRLNEAALQLVSQIEKYKPIPEGHRGPKLSVEVPIDYILN